MLSTNLSREECDKENVHELLLLLKRYNSNQIDDNSEITKQEWNEVAKKAKKSSASSTPSKRDYSALDCALFCERMTHELTIFYDVILKHNHYPKRSSCVADEISEKGKGQKINKSRISELIEAGTQLLMRIFLEIRIDEEHEND